MHGLRADDLLSLYMNSKNDFIQMSLGIIPLSLDGAELVCSGSRVGPVRRRSGESLVVQMSGGPVRYTVRAAPDMQRTRLGRGRRAGHRRG